MGDRSLIGAVVGVADPDTVAALWASILGGPPPGVSFVADPDERGLIEIRVAVTARDVPAAIPVGTARDVPAAIPVGTARVVAQET